MSQPRRMMDDGRLVHKVNQIALFHEPYPPEAAVAGVAEHLRKFWTPAMRKQLQDFAAAPSARQQLHPLIRKALTHLPGC